MATLLEMANRIVSAHAQSTPMTITELLAEIQKIHSVLQSLDSGAPVTEEPVETPTLTLKQAFRTNEVFCMICGKGMQTITRHLNQTHQMKPNEYRKQFSIPKSQKLMSKAYVAKRKEIAAVVDLKGNMEKARAVRMSNIAVKVATVPAVKTKAPVPAVKKKAAVPAKTEKK